MRPTSAIITRSRPWVRSFGATAAMLACSVSTNAQYTYEPMHTFHGDTANDTFGWFSRCAGDVNGDGFGDVIVGAWNASLNGIPVGSARVFSGTDGNVLHTFYGEDADGRFGQAASGAGDVNRDGLDDVIVGARLADGGVGLARVYSGATGDVLHEFRGIGSSDYFGTSVSGVGDVNGDGHADVICGTYNANSAHVYSGATGHELFAFYGTDPGDRFGRNVNNAGDVDGDGLNDFIVGAPYADGVHWHSTGQARVFSGATGQELYTFYGVYTGNNFGHSVSGAGDVDGDGFDDLLVAAPFDNENGNAAGAAYLFSGATGDRLAKFLGDHANDRFAYAVSTAGDVNGDGLDDVIVSGYLSSHQSAASGAGYAIVYTAVPCQTADTNCDGECTASDFNAWVSAFNDQSAACDQNRDGLCTPADFSAWILNYNTCTPGRRRRSTRHAPYTAALRQEHPWPGSPRTARPPRPAPMPRTPATTSPMT